MVGSSGEGASKKTEFVIHVPADGVWIEASNGENRLIFDLAAAADLNNGKTGKPVKTIDREVNTSVPDAQMASFTHRRYRHEEYAGTWPRHHVVRVVVRDNVTGKIDSVTAPLTVN